MVILLNFKDVIGYKRIPVLLLILLLHSLISELQFLQLKLKEVQVIQNG